MPSLALTPAEKEAIVVEVQSRVLLAKLDELHRNHDLDLAALINGSLYHERRRLETHRNAPGAKEDRRFWAGIRKRLTRAPSSELREILASILYRYVSEIIGNFDPRVHALATRVIPVSLSALIHTLSPSRVARNLPRLGEMGDLDDHLLIQGEVETLRKLEKIGTVILVPTHSSNLDSLVIGYALHLMGLPPFTYGAGLNLFTNPLISFFMANLGAYRVDRTKRDPLYMATLKEYATYTLETGLNNLFFPGGTRSRSGEMEQHLKLGLLGTGLAAYQNNLALRKDPAKIFIVPCTLSYHLVLEAETLIEDSLEEAGKSRFIIEDDEFSKPMRILNFFNNVVSLDSQIYVTVGEPLDPFGNRVLADGTSVDHRDRPIDITGYVNSRGKLQVDANRDAEYTRELGRSIAATFRRDNVLLSTHLLATVLFRMCRERHADLDLYRMLRSGGVERQGFALAEVHTRMQEVARKLQALVARGEVRVGDGVGADGAEIVTDALKHFGVYHTRPAAVRRGDRIFPTDPKLLLFYSNRTKTYDL